MRGHDIASQQKLRKELKRIVKRMDGYKYDRIEYKAHGGHAQIFFSKDDINYKMTIGTSKNLDSNLKTIRSSLLRMDCALRVK